MQNLLFYAANSVKQKHKREGKICYFFKLCYNVFMIGCNGDEEKTE